MRIFQDIRIAMTIIACWSFSTVSLADEAEKVADFVEELMGTKPKLVQRAELDGFFTVALEDLTIMYVSSDLQWILQGDVTEIKSSGKNPHLVAHTDVFRNQARQNLLESIDPENVIAFPPPFEAPKSAVYVFTDTTCGYCQKLHAELNDYHQKGIEIRYLAYPRAGVGSDPYKAMVSAWCAENPQAAMTRLKRGIDIEEQSCSNPVANQYELGRKMGLRGTPLIVLTNGKTIGGYVNAEELGDILTDEGLM